MKLMKFLALSYLLLLVACGSSGGQETVAALGKAHLSSALVGASVQVLDERGQPVTTAARTTDAAGIFDVDLPRGHRSRFRVVVKGGTYEGKPFLDTLLLDVDHFDPATGVLYANAATTLISRYMDRHPGANVADASAKVKKFLMIPLTSDAGFNVDNPLQNYFRHEKLLADMQASGETRLDNYLWGLVAEIDAGVASHVFARSALLGGGIDSIVGSLLKFLGKELGKEAFGLAFEHAMTALGLDGTAEILRELHEINHKLDELTALTQEVLAAEKDTQLQALTVKLSGDITKIRGLYAHLTTIAQTSIPACLTSADGKPLDPACEEQRQARLKVQREKVQGYMDTILKGAYGTTSVELKLADIAATLIKMTDTEPGLLGRADEFFKTSAHFQSAVTDQRLIDLKNYYQTVQAMGVHLLVESYMAQQAPAGASQADKDALKEQARRDAQAVLDQFNNVSAKAQDDRIEEMRYKNEFTVEQLRANLVWLRAPFSNLKTPYQDDGGGWHDDWPTQADKLCANLAKEHYAGYSDWRLPTETELHAFVKGSPNDSGNADGGNGIFEWLVTQGFQRGPGNGQLFQRGIVVDSTMKTAYFSSTGVVGGYTEALWDYGIDSAADIPRYRTGKYIPSIAGAWCVTAKGGGH